MKPEGLGGMMRRTNVVILAVAIVAMMTVSAFAADNGGRIYGKILTVDGDTFEGLIRWDKNEANWVDILNGTKELPERQVNKSKKNRRKYSDRGSSISIFGLKIGSTSNSIFWSGSASSGIRFGHIRSLSPTGDDSVELVLKSGEKVELSGGSTDIGTGIREIIIEDNDEGEIELVWDDIEDIEFMSARTDERSAFGDRIYGTLTTRRGNEFTGFICWDVDELLTSDILDGDAKGRRRKIKFGKIASIERYSSSGARVVLNNGDELILKGTNDVDQSNSGIIVSDMAFGQIIVMWDEFDRLDFTDVPSEGEYNDFDGGRLIRGTVHTEDGDSYTGTIVWDNDEEYTWEILDGTYRDVEFDVEFGLIKEIEKKSYRSCIITVSDGRTFRLSGSNDVDEDNKGIFVTLKDGEVVEIDWEDFERVEFN